jgi:hypothetical protein
LSALLKQANQPLNQGAKIRIFAINELGADKFHLVSEIRSILKTSVVGSVAGEER